MGTIALLALLLQAAPPGDSARRAVYRAYLDFGDLVHGGRVVPGWLPDGTSFWYAEGSPQDRSLVKVTAAGKKEPLLDPARLRAALTEQLGYEPAGRGVPIDQLGFAGPNRIRFNLEGRSWELDLESYRLTKLAAPMALDYSPLLPSEQARVTPRLFLKEGFTGLGASVAPESMSPDGKWFVSMKDDNLVLRATVDGRTIPLTTDGQPGLYWDVETVKWNPWSPDGQRLAAFKIDSRGMAKIPTIQWLKPLEEATEVITIPAGGKLNRDELWIVDVFRGAPVKADLGDTSDQYLTILGWTPDNGRVLVARYNRVMNRADVIAVDAATGATKVLLTEQSKTFVTNQHEAVWGTDTGFWLLPDGSGFIWRSERDGWAHFYRYDSSGALVARLTHGEFPVRNVARIDQKNGWVYYYAHADQSRPYDTHLYRVRLDGTATQQLTDGPGQHEALLAPSAEWFVDNYSSVDTPPKSVLRRTDGKVVMPLADADIHQLRKVGWVAPREYVVKAADGKTDLWATMYFPSDFDSTKTYPVVEYIYAGPQTMVRPMDFGAAPLGAAAHLVNFNRALANLGFLVVILDGRGTPGRSKAFHDAIYRNWGNFEIADHSGAIRQLGQKLRFVDVNRVGIMGASWGGHYTFRALTQAPDLYRVGIAEFPGFDPRSFTLYEIYLGMPLENKALYDAADPFPLAAKLKGKLLLNSGLNDTGTMKDLVKMSDVLARLGIQHDVMFYANTGHGAFGKLGEYNLDLKVNYFLRYLAPLSNP